MKKIKYYLLAIVLLGTVACSDIFDFLKESEDGLSEAEIIQGLKRALDIGADSAIATVSITDGYYGDQLIKILLPPQADIILQYKDEPILQAVGIDQMVEDVIIGINRAAEDAAKDAKPIFVEAITNMTIEDGITILQSQDTAATHYLREKTFTSLKAVFAPKMNASLEKDLIGAYSANDAWNNLTETYNEIASSIAGQLLGLETVDTNLSEYVTGQGLNGLFVKVGDEEKKIRENPYDWVDDIIRKVFGSLFE